MYADDEYAEDMRKRLPLAGKLRLRKNFNGGVEESEWAREQASRQEEGGRRFASRQHRHAAAPASESLV